MKPRIPSTVARIGGLAFSSVFVFLLLSQPATLFGQYETNLPLRVKGKLKEQFQSYFSDKPSFLNIPLLDSGVNWGNFDKWPNQFRFQGREYKLHLMGDGGDYDYPIDDRVKAEPGKGLWVNMGLQNRAEYDAGVIAVSSHWLRGKVQGKRLIRAVEVKGSRPTMRLIFGFQLYFTGEVYTFEWQGKDEIHSHMEFYEKSGNLMGYIIYPHKPMIRAEHFWKDGTKTDSESFHKRIRELKGFEGFYP